MARRTGDSRQLTTTVQVMKALGGIKGVSALTGSSYGSTENWSRAPSFPARFFLVMSFALHSKRLSAPPELWGQVTPAQRRAALRAVIAAVQKQKAAA